MRKILTISIVLVLLGLTGYGMFSALQWTTVKGFTWYQGTPSTGVWLESDTFTDNHIVRLTKEDGKDFTILLFADIQLESSPTKDRKALKMIDTLVSEVSPNMIMTVGDNTSWTFANRVAEKLAKQLDGYGIPWGVTLGNHDSEGMADRVWHGNLYEGGENSIFSMGPSNVQGIGNYSVLIEDESGEPLYSLIMMDSNERRTYPNGENGYDFIYPNQIDWYQWTVQGIENITGQQVPSMLFFHIPLLEFEDAYNAVIDGDIDEDSYFGENQEGVYAAKVNTGLFQRALDLGSTTHIFSGHDHVNSLSVPWQGIQLTYALKTGPASYWDKSMQGATRITIKDTTNEVVIEHLYK